MSSTSRRLNSPFPRSLLKKQMAFQLARQQILIETDDVELSECLNNTHLSRYFISLARELDVLEPKIPEDIYKSHLENHRKKKKEGGSLARTNPFPLLLCDANRYVFQHQCRLGTQQSCFHFCECLCECCLWEGQADDD